MWEAVINALSIRSGQELQCFDLDTVEINHTHYTILTGYEGSGRCFWCGGELKGKQKRYCYGHMQEYYNHFNWGYASFEAKRRTGYRCENCGRSGGRLPYSKRTSLEVHHIVPLRGKARFFSAYNLPWNLIALCHECHLEIHAVMRDGHKPLAVGVFEVALSQGQAVMRLEA